MQLNEDARQMVKLTLLGLLSMLTLAPAAAEGWIHPAGLIDRETLADVRHKRAAQPWAVEVLARMDRTVQPWLAQPLERLAELMPTERTRVYWLLQCPDCGQPLPFNAFDNRHAPCTDCEQIHNLQETSTAAPPDAPYAGTLYDGWGCHYLMTSARMAQDLALLHALGAERAYAERAADILRLFAQRTKGLPVAGSGSFQMIWTYAYEGDCHTLIPLATAYELVRDVEGLLSAEDHRAIQRNLLKHWVDSVFRIETDQSQRHNNTYAILTAVALVGCALEDTDYVDWAFGQRRYALDVRPDHRSLAWLGANNYLDDGAFWGLCSAYHLYALGPHCRAILLGAKLSRQMPDLFPAELYDEMVPTNPRARTARRALTWFTAQALPDLTTAPFGDMGGRVSLALYALTAEIGYKFLGIDEVGQYPSLRRGNRGEAGLLYGAETIEARPFSHPSAYLTSGYAALRRKTTDNHLYAGLNALQPGSGHSHGDRLNLITYSRDRLLAGEKRTLYTNPEQRVYSGASYAHNMVTVDETSQEHGNMLSGERIPRIDTFVDLPTFSAAAARGDKIYPTTSVYRRLILQFDQYLVDFFEVVGGQTHDWFHHGIGAEPSLSVPTVPARLGPAFYVTGGGEEHSSGSAEQGVTATWRIAAQHDADYAGRKRDLYSRVMLAGQPGQQTGILDTYPDPGRFSLVVRHPGPASLFAAVHEAYHDRPFASAIRPIPMDQGRGFEVRHADGGKRIILLGPGADADELRTDAQLALLELNPSGQIVGAGILRGTTLRYGGLRLTAENEACLSVALGAAGPELASSPPVAYQTIEGKPIHAPAQRVAVELHLPASISPTGQALDVRRHLPAD
jgi:heparinase II/III-like protein